VAALIKETGGSEEFPSRTEGFEAEEESEETEGFRTLVKGLEAGVSEEMFGPERAELGTDLCPKTNAEVESSLVI